MFQVNNLQRPKVYNSVVICDQNVLVIVMNMSRGLYQYTSAKGVLELVYLFRIMPTAILQTTILQPAVRVPTDGTQSYLVIIIFYN